MIQGLELIIILILSAIIHEYSHGYFAYRLGDDTALKAGRLTLNPLAHIDLVGSIFLPLLLVLSGSGLIFGWAKPVPYNPYNLRDQKRGNAKVAFAGPVTNLIIAVIFAFWYRISNLEIFALVVLVNLVLAIFNLVPIPPLDGSKILYDFLPLEHQKKYISLERYGIIILLAFIFFAWPLISPFVYFLFNLLI